MLRTESLTYKYPKSNIDLHFPDISLKAQEQLLILGKSGVGKTTFLHLLAGLLKPVNGNIWIHNTEITQLTHQKLDVFRGQHIGMVFQNNHAIKSLTVEKNLVARLFFSKQKQDKNLIDNLLRDLGLFDFKTKKINELSQGQLQRLGIAMAVIHKPNLILADEPTSSLDDENCKLVMELLQKQAQLAKANLIVITHDHRIKSLFSNPLTL